MNRSVLKSYAPKARLDFIQAVTDRAAYFGLTPQCTEPIQESGDVVIIGGRAFPKTVAQQRRSLEARVQRQGFEQVVEAIAYTWFNRFVALRYMELHGYLDHGYRVLSHPEGRATPEIVEQAENVTLPGLDTQEVVNLKLDGTKEAELYRALIVAQCNALHEAMPFLFEKIADDTELLLPDNLLHSDSVIRNLVTEIEEADWQQVEIIGWLYQFYISDKKDEVIGKVVKSEDIPAATQLFTPNWIVKYLVQNTLGRQWLATYPDSPLRQQMEYYIEPAEQTDEVKAQLAAITPKSLDPEALTLLDPASGSGHILVEAYDLFKAIYRERGYRSKDIPRLILQKNLFGLEIDDRAAQLAAFALLMKARADDRRIFSDHIQPNVLAIQESRGSENLLRPDLAAATGVGELPFAASDLFPDTQKQLTPNKNIKGSPLAEVAPCLHELTKLFEHGKTFGSLIRLAPSFAKELSAVRQQIEAMISAGQLWQHRAAALLLPLVTQAEFLSKTYDTVVTNPPYMGSKFYSRLLKEWIELNFAEGRSDLYSCFMERCLLFAKKDGYVGMITIPNWMFLPTFEVLRANILSSQTINTFIYNGRGIWGSDFGSCAFTFINRNVSGYVGTYRQLFDKQGSVATVEELRERFFVHKSHHVSQNEFPKIPGSPIAFWTSDRVRGAFQKGISLGKLAEPRQGMATGDNARFVRFWFEVDRSAIGIGCAAKEEAWASSARWFPYNKGGPFRKWYGNAEHVLRFDEPSYRLLRTVGNHCPSERFYFREGVTWGLITVAAFSCRYVPNGFVFDVGGSSAFPDPKDLHVCLTLLNSNVCALFLRCLNPTVNTQVGDLKRIPVLADGGLARSRISEICVQLIDHAKRDWDSVETSWDFSGSPLLVEGVVNTLEVAFKMREKATEESIHSVKSLEEESNKLIIEAYGLQEDVSHEVSEGQITILRADQQLDIQRLISYAIGCMMGRYSLDKPGLIYALSRNEGFDPTQYRTFSADADGIIPITELAWFSDDAAERFVEFIAKAWPREHLEENLKFIADSLGPNRDEHPRDTIRRYQATGFYKDHLSTYKRRPIYWLFSSGKQRAFQCLVYLHRYHEGTLARMRTEYVIPLQGKINHRIEQLAGDIAAATSTSHRRKLEKEKESLVKQSAELTAFDEKLHHYADQRIAFDLDDGVKVNYGKFGDLLAEVKAVTGGSEE